MILKKLQIENIRSFESQEIIFPIGSTLLSGDIGVGKTSILLAIEFALFGLQPSQKGSSLLRSDSEFAKVTLEFSIDNKDIIIERNLKRGSKSISQEYASISIDEEKFEGSITEIKARVLKLLNYPDEFAKKTNLLYKFTVYTPQEEMKQIILETGDTKINTLRYVFGIEKYKKIEENTGIFTSKLKEIIRTNEGRLFDLKELNENLITKKENLEKLKQNQLTLNEEYELTKIQSEKAKELLLEIEFKIKEKKELELEISKSEILIKEKQQQLNLIENNSKNIEIQISDIKSIDFTPGELSAIDERITFQDDKLEELQKDSIKIISLLNSLESKIKETANLKEKISKLEKCPTCLQIVSTLYKDNIFKKATDELNFSNNELKKYTIDKEDIIGKINETKNLKDALIKKKIKLEEHKNKIDNIKDKIILIENLKVQKNTIIKDLEELNIEVNKLNKSIEQYQKYDKLYIKRNLDLEKAKKMEYNAAIKKAETNKEIQLSFNQIKEISNTIKIKKLLKNKTDKLKEILYWISQNFLNLILFTEKQVMITLKDEFSKLFSNWFSILVSEDLTAKLDDNFSPIIEQQDFELDYSFLSGGERTAIALAYRLSLNQVINSMLSKIKTRNLVILDEPTEGFSSAQLDKMRDVLSQLKTEQLIIVSHEQKIEGFVDNIIRVKKENGVSRVEG